MCAGTCASGGCARNDAPALLRGVFKKFESTWLIQQDGGIDAIMADTGAGGCSRAKSVIYAIMNENIGIPAATSVISTLSTTPPGSPGIADTEQGCLLSNRLVNMTIN